MLADRAQHRDLRDSAGNLRRFRQEVRSTERLDSLYIVIFRSVSLGKTNIAIKTEIAIKQKSLLITKPKQCVLFLSAPQHNHRFTCQIRRCQTPIDFTNATVININTTLFDSATRFAV